MGRKPKTAMEEAMNEAGIEKVHVAKKVHVFTTEDLDKMYEEVTMRAVVTCEFTTDLVGGLPATEEGIRSFVVHYLGLKGQEADDAVKRIQGEEIGERDTTPEATSEIKEKLSYGINVVRRDEHGPYLGNWMAKAMLKTAFSRLEIFVAKKGSKGDVAEMGRLLATGISLKNLKKPQNIYLIDANTDAPAATYFDKFRGRVQSPQGAKSIVNDAECVPAGTRFEFEFRMYQNKVTARDVAQAFAASQVIGLGSCKSFERGKFRAIQLTVEEAEKPRSGKKGSEDTAADPDPVQDAAEQVQDGKQEVAA